MLSHRLLGRLAVPWPVRLLLVVFAALGVVVVLGGAARGDGLGSITSGGVEVRASETVDSVDVRPALSLSLSRDLADVQPGGRIVYSPTLTNTGAQLRITGTVRAKDAGQAAAEIAAFHDYIDYYSKSQAKWVPIAGTAAARVGYTPTVSPPLATGLSLSLSSQPASGVSYGTGGAPVGTRLEAGAEAVWSYAAIAELSPAQARALMDQSDVQAVRNVVRFEMTAQGGTASDGQSRQQGFTKQLQSQSADVTDAHISVQPPSGSALGFSSATDPALARLRPGDAVSVSRRWTIPTLDPKGSSESDTDYRARLLAADGATLAAQADASATANGTSTADPSSNATDSLLDTADLTLGDNATVQSVLDLLLAHEANPIVGPARTLTSASASTSSVRHVPVLSLAKSGPETVGTGETADYPLTLHNSGSAAAVVSSLTDSAPDAAATNVTDVPATVSAAGSTSATGHVTAREDADPGPLTDVASVTWRDANDSAYGPVSASFSTQVTPNLETAVQLGTTTITPDLVSTVSPDQPSGAPGDTVHYAITVTNDGSSLEFGATTSARYTGSGSATVSAASVLLETRDATTGSWQPLASWQIHQGGYTPAVTPSIGDLTVDATPQPAGGVSYPPTARNVLGTSVASGSTAAWAITANADLDQAQSRRLISAAASDAARVSVRFELVDDAGRRVAGKTQRLDVTPDIRTQSGHARGATVDLDLPDGSVQTVGQQTAPALADLALGDSASFSVAGGLPAPDAKAAGESDQDYLQRLQRADQTNAFASATASATTDGAASRDATGQLSQGPDRALSGAAGRGGVQRLVPVVSLADVGPASASPGGRVTYVVTAANTGHLAASGIDLRDQVNGAADSAMPSGPQALAAGTSAQATRETDVPVVQSAGSFTHTASVTWHDGQGNTYGPVSDSAATQIVAADIPTAPALDLSGVTGIDEANGFLTQGSDPTQTGLASGAISPIRASVIRGTLLDRDAGPIAGATVTIVGHPEYGQSTTRSDGGIFMLVNAGLPLRLRFHKDGYLDAERDVAPRTQDYTWIDDVALVHEEQASTGIDLGLAAPAQVARGAQETDSSGTRQATLIFQPGTTASLQMPDGSSQPVSHLTLHVTEFTVGPRGPEAMPADLPPTSGYTYAAAFNADEVAAAGASGVSFSTPVAGYVENFVGFPVGDTVPSGSYDPTKGAWVPSTSGRVIKILSITNGMADLDTSGSGQAASTAQLAALGITDTERAQLATLYPAGRVLWRVPMTHFSLWDWNWWTGFPSGASGPPGGAPDGGGPGPDGCGKHCSDPSACTDQGGSTIECENQILHEDADVQGTGMSLDYSSGRQQGRAIDRTVTVPISGASPPSSLKRIDIQVDIAGQHTEFTRSTTPNQTFTYTWDGRDGYGRQVQGAAKALVRIGYVYDLVYGGGSPQFGDAPTASYSVNARSEGTVWRDVNLTLGGFDQRLAGIGGWSLSDHHAYDPVSRTLYMGDGTVRSAGSVNATISTLAMLTGRDWPAYGVLAAPDGSIYFSANSVIRRLLPDGTYQTVAGTPGTTGFAGDGGPATSALVAGARGLALGPDGSLYFADSGNNRVRRISPSGIITTIAGNGQTNPGLAGDGGPATQAVIDYPTAVKVAADGTVYIAEVGPTYCCNNGLVRKVDANGRITTVAGRLDRTGTSVIEGQSATSAYFDYLSDLALAPDGSIIVADANHCRIRRIDTSGRVYTIAGTSPSGTQVACGSDGNGGPATSAHIDHPYWLALAPDGSIYFRETDHRIRKVNPDGTIANVAGTGVSGLSGDGGPATQAKIWGPEGLTIDAAGNIIFVDFYNQRLRKIAPPLPGFTGTDLAIPSTDGSELYRFDEHGRHLATVDTHTAKTLETFAYDDRGHLTGITDLDGDTVTIAYALNGSPTSITGPFGQQTQLHVDASGYLDAITDAAGNRAQMHYQPGGLMDSITSPAGHTAHMSWTSLGLLSTDTDADGVSKTYTRSDRYGGRTVTTTTALGHTKTNSYDLLADGTVHRAITGYDGLTTTLDLRSDGSRTANDPTGAVATYSLGGDPRFGMNAPLVSSAGLTTPGGRHLTTSATRQVTLANALDPLSLQTETQTTTINGRTATATYTAAQRKLTVTSAAGRAASVTYDANGRPQTDHIDGVLDVSTSYDSHGRLSGVVQGARSESYTYDASGRPDTATDAAGRVTSFAWDAADRLTALTLPDGRQIGYSYDADGNLTSITPPGRPNHSFTSTPAGRGQDATAPVAPGGGAGTHLHYDADGQLVRVTRPDGQDIVIGHDGAGRISTITRPEGGAVTYHYSPTSGQVSSVDSPDGETVSYAYDGPLTTSSSFSGPVAGTVTAGYDDDLRLASLNVTGSDAVGYSYDPDSLLTNVGSLGITRDPANGRVTATTQGNVTSSQTYNTYGELSGLTWTTGAGTLLGLDYTRDQLGRVTQATDSGTLGARTRTYTYDTAGRLTSADENGAPALRVSYDDNSNPTSIQRGSALPVTASYDDQDRLLRYGNTTYTYDPNGQLKTATTSGQTTSYTFDGLGRLTKVVLPDGKTITYTLDAFGRRVARKVNGAITAQYLYAGGLNPVAELDASGNLISRFVYGQDPTTPEYLIRAGHTYRYISDQLGSVRALVDTADGTIAEKLDYDPTGVLTQDTQAGFQPFGYAGGLNDPDTKLWHYGARDYDPTTLRWLSRDPLGFGGGDPNVYGYAFEDPVDLRDSTGANVNLMPGPGEQPLNPDLPGTSLPGIAEVPDVRSDDHPRFRCNDNCLAGPRSAGTDVALPRIHAPIADPCSGRVESASGAGSDSDTEGDDGQGEEHGPQVPPDWLENKHGPNIVIGPGVSVHPDPENPDGGHFGHWDYHDRSQPGKTRVYPGGYDPESELAL